MCSLYQREIQCAPTKAKENLTFNILADENSQFIEMFQSEENRH